MAYKAILPKRMPSERIDPQSDIDRNLRNFAVEFQLRMQDYPPAKPWKSRPPTSGPRRGGRRTGGYGDGWAGSPRFTKRSVTINNSVRYAIYVGGPKQTNNMKQRGWRKMGDVGKEVARDVWGR